MRAVFVPDGEQGPPEFAADFHPLRMRATHNNETGEITCHNAGMAFGGDVRAQWVPVEDTEFGVVEELSDYTSGEAGNGEA